jgi:hypothetical protein
MGAPSVGRPIANALGRSYTAAKSTVNSNIILYRGDGGSAAPSGINSRWQNGECVQNDTTTFHSLVVSAGAILDVTSTFPTPWTVEGDGDIPISMNSAGDVGIGTLSPTEKVHVVENANANTLLVVDNPNTGTAAVGVLRAKSNVATVNFQAHGSNRVVSRFGQVLGGWAEMLGVAGNGFAIGTVGATPLILGTNSTNRLTIAGVGGVGIGVTLPAHPLHMASGAHVTAGGVWTNGSSREYKFDVQTLDADEAKRAISSLEPVTFRYKNERDELYVGFIAEDVPQLVANTDRKSLSPMDVVAVLTKVVQEQNRTIEELNARVRALETSQR